MLLHVITIRDKDLFPVCFAHSYSEELSIGNICCRCTIQSVLTVDKYDNVTMIKLLLFFISNLQSLFLYKHSTNLILNLSYARNSVTILQFTQICTSCINCPTYTMILIPNSCNFFLKTFFVNFILLIKMS